AGVSDKPTGCLDATSLVVCSYGCDDGRIGPTHCAVIGGALGDRSRARCACKTPPAGAYSTRSVLAGVSRPASTAAPGGFLRSRTRPRSGSTPCDDASPPRSVPRSVENLSRLYSIEVN